MKLYDVLGAGLMMESVNVLSDHCQLPALRLQPRLQLSQSLRMYILGRGYTHVYIHVCICDCRVSYRSFGWGGGKLFLEQRN